MLNQKGFTLTELTIASGLIGVLSLGALKLYEDSNGHLNKITAQSGAEDIVLNVERVLSNPTYCKEALSGKSVTSTLTSLGTSGSVDATLLQYTHPKLGVTKIVGEDKYKNFIIPDNGVKIQESEFSPSIGKLFLNFEVGGSVTGTKKIQKVIYLSTVKSGSVITACSSISNSEDTDAKRALCLRIGTSASGFGATWDSAAGKCLFQGFSCPVGELVTGISNFGSVTCGTVVSKIQNNLSSYFDVTTKVDCTGKNNLKLTTSLGKYQLTCE